MKFDVSANGVTLETAVIGHTIINELMRFQKKTIFQTILDFKILNELKRLPGPENLIILLELMRFNWNVSLLMEVLELGLHKQF